MEKVGICCRSSNARLMWLFVAFLFYLCVGAFVFVELESDVENENQSVFLKRKLQFRSAHPCISGKNISIEAIYLNILR